MKYTREWFLDKFEALSNDDVGSASLENHCALFHCGMRDIHKPTKEALALAKLLSPYSGIDGDALAQAVRPVYVVNDAYLEVPEHIRLLKRPRSRILRALRELPEGASA